MKKPDVEVSGKFKSITVNQEVYDELDALRERQKLDLGLPELSWNGFFSMWLKRQRDEKTK
jgi:hypothetical protein